MLTQPELNDQLLATLEKIDPANPIPIQLEPFLLKKMNEEPVFKIHTILIKQDELFKKAYFIASGYVVLYRLENGKKDVFRIYRPGHFVAVQFLMKRSFADFYMVALKDTTLLSIEATALKMMCDEIPGAERLILKAADSCDKKEMVRNRITSGSKKDTVKTFYRTFKGMLPPGELLNDEEIASYLKMGKTMLKLHRRELLKEDMISS